MTKSWHRRAGTRRIVLAFLLSAGLFPVGEVRSATPTDAAPPRMVSGHVVEDAVWEGTVVVEGMVSIQEGATLTIRPGAEVRFGSSGGLVVGGALMAQGEPGKPVRFLPAVQGQEPWVGIALGGAAPSVLRSCTIVGARVIDVSAGSPRIERCEITGGAAGIQVGGFGTAPLISGNRIADIAGNGIECTPKAVPVISDNTIERCGRTGILAQTGSSPEITGNRVTGCDGGIELYRVSPRIVGNTVTGCVRGITLISVSGGEPVRGNRVEGNQVGISCQQFTAPELVGNTVTRNRDGIVCFMGATPLIQGNDVLDNETGLVCDQFSDALVRANTLTRNRRGVFLDRSSYASIHGNNFADNEVQVELGFMSLAWEAHSGGKPARGRARQNQVLVEQDRAAAGIPGAPGAAGDGFEAAGRSLDLSGNWWGEATTREMAEKGPNANISSFKDGYDPRPYESQHQQDRIVYSPWAKAPIVGAGVAAVARKEGPAAP